MKQEIENCNEGTWNLTFVCKTSSSNTIEIYCNKCQQYNFMSTLYFMISLPTHSQYVKLSVLEYNKYII